jgi:amino acid adenylation domain-containing protein
MSGVLPDARPATAAETIQASLDVSKAISQEEGAMTLCELLQEASVRHPGRIAFCFVDPMDSSGPQEITITYEELVRQSQHFAARLTLAGVGERAILLYPAGLDFIVAFFACLFAGIIAVPLPVPKSWESDTFLKIVENAKPRFILSTKRLHERLDKNNTFAGRHPSSEWIILESGRLNIPEQEPVLHARKRDDIAYLQYTSGSTSSPRGVIVKHGNVIVNCNSVKKLWQMNESSMAVSWLPHFHDMGLITAIILPLTAGCTSVLLPPAIIVSKPLHWLSAINRFRGTHSAGPGFAYQSCVDKVTPEEIATLDLSSWQIAQCGAEPIRQATVKQFLERFTPAGFHSSAFRPAYGLAEATLVVSQIAADRNFRRRLLDSSALAAGFAADTSDPTGIAVVSCGAPIDTAAVLVIDPKTFRSCPDNIIGECWVEGPSVASGYWEDIERTLEVFHGTSPDYPDRHFLRTGDLGFRDDGEIFISGRLKDLIIIRGRNIHPTDVEALAQSSHASVHSMGSAAFAVEKDGIDQLVIVQEVRRVKRHHLDGVIDAIRQGITSEVGVTPSSIVLVNEFSIPRTSSGKIRRKACREQYLVNRLSVLDSWVSQGFVLPTTNQAASGSMQSLAGRAVLEIVARRAGISEDAICRQKSFSEYCFDSNAAVEAAAHLSSLLSRNFESSLLYDHPTVEQLISYLDNPDDTEKPEAGSTLHTEGAKRLSSLSAASPGVGEYSENQIAIIGIGCRFPGADGPEQFWSLLQAGRCSITEYPSDRLKLADTSVPFRGGFLEGIDAFDASFFRISPVEASLMDPQQRLLMEVTLHSLEDAGVTRSSTKARRVGVFVGISNSDYARDTLRVEALQDSYTVSGAALSIAANRLSYAFDWIGPSLSIDTACSSSLVAVHQAIRSLRTGDCELAVVGGANIILSRAIYNDFHNSGLLSPDGLCKAFDKTADGYVRSEGIGVIVLRRLKEAQENKDRIYAVILGSDVNHNGKSNGLLAPKREGQRAVLEGAWKDAGIRPGDLSYIEAHGTGTALGDAIELQTVHAALAGVTDHRKCRIGSVKSNIGHTESAAGIAGLIKTALALYREYIPPTLHFRALSDQLSAARLSVLIADKLQAWPRDIQRVAGVSSFGFGGSNAHVVVAGYKESPPLPNRPSLPEEKLQLFPLSAESPEALRRLCLDYDQALSSLPDERFGQLCANLALRRDHYSKRLAIVARNPSEARRALKEIAFVSSEDALTNHRPLIFVFSGQGSYRDGLGTKLMQRRAFRDVMDACTSILDSTGLPSAVDILAGANCEAFDQRYDGQQLRIFLFQVGISALLHSLGIKPDALVGHSLGEVAAAHLAGVLTLDESIKLILLRSELSKVIGGQGTLLAVRMSSARCTTLIAELQSSVHIAVYNGPNNIAVSGTHEDIEVFSAALASRKIPAQRVKINYAAHSSALDPYRERFLQNTSMMTSRRPVMPLYSSTLGAAVGESSVSVEHWWNNFRRPVHFSSAVGSALQDGFRDFLEVSGFPVLLPSIKDNAGSDIRVNLYPTGDLVHDEEHSLFLSLANLYSKGAEIAWEGLIDEPCTFASFLSYPFQRETFWHKSVKTTGGAILTKSQRTDEVQENGIEASSETSVQIVTAQVRDNVARCLQQQVDLIDLEAPFLELGADSIIMTKALRAIEQRFNVPLSITQLFEHQRTVSSLAAFVHRTMDHPSHIERTSSQFKPGGANHLPLENGSASPSIEKIMLEQLGSISRLVTQQMEVLHSALLKPSIRDDTNVTSQFQAAASTSLPLSNGHQRDCSSLTANRAERFVPYQPFDIQAPKTGAVAEMLGKSLRERLQKKTHTSKALAQNNRRILADNRASAGFRMSTKELLYPIHSERSQGAYIYDCDGNKYVDLTMGFGVNLFGHNPDFVRQALAEQLDKGFSLGPQTPVAGEVARLITQFTDMERVTFCNSGTEAVMTALRLARAATGRRKIVIFEESYHGTFDGILADHNDGESSAIPLAPGITPGFVEDLYILSYNDRQSIRFIERHTSEIAAVLVEPVRSRRPDCQAHDFLGELRHVTAQGSIALIFDEVITGFRIAQGGAQEWFGIQADIAIYGKVLGGGMPIGVVTGKASFLDAIDGGFWNYNDQSYPTAATTFFAGTFCKHPLTMVASRAALLHMQAAGPDLQRNLNKRTTDLAARLNHVFQEHETPVEVAHFGSLFRFRGNGNWDPIFYHLLDRGVYIWEGRNCFISTAHTEADIDLVVDAVDDMLKEIGKNHLTAPPRDKTPCLDGASREKHIAISGIPLDSVQRATWAALQADPGVAGAYTVALVAELSGPLDLDLFRNAVATAALQYDALRMSVAADGEHAILGPPPELYVETIEHWPVAEVKQRTEAWILEKATFVFELSLWPTSAISLLKSGPTSHVLVIAAHHILCDGASLGLILERVIRRYEFCKGSEQEEPTEPTVSTFTKLQADGQSTPERVAHQGFWLQELARLVPLVNVIGAAVRPQKKTFAADRLRRELDSEIVLDLLRLSRARGFTAFMTLLTAWGAAIGALSETVEFRIACPVSTRSEADEAFVGYRQNLLPIRVTTSAPNTMLGDLQQTKAAALDCLSHREYPFSDMCQLAKHLRVEDRFPLADIGFNYEKYPLTLRTGNLQVDIRMAPITTALLDLTLNISDASERFIADLDFNTDIYSRSLAEKCLDTLEAQLWRMRSELLGNPSALTPERPRDQKNLTCAVMQLIPAAVEGWAQEAPEAVACRYGSEELSYGQLNGRANRLGRYLQGLEVGPEVLVGVCLKRGLTMVCSLLAVMKAGGAYLPLDPEYPLERLLYMIEDSGVRVVLTHRGLKHLFAGIRAQVICVEDEEVWAHLEATDPCSRIIAENLAYVIYTSGSTGQPKGVMLTQGGLANLVMEQIRLFDLVLGTRALQVASPSFDASVFEIWATLASGGQLELASADELRPGRALETLLRDRQIEVVTLTPTALSLLSPESPLPHLRTLIVAGEACSASLAEHWRHGRHLINAYGPTEATVCATAGLIDTPGIPALGSPLGQVHVQVLDELLDPVPAGTPGELYIGGQGVARGYLNRPSLTAECFLPDPARPGQRLYRTGDLVRFDDHGQLHFLGRIDHQIKFHGIRLEPAEIEAALRRIPGVADAVVQLRTDLGEDHRLVAYLTSVPGMPSPSADQLRTHAQDLLPSQMLPNSYVLLPAFPTTPNGKLDRAALPVPPTARPNLDNPYVPPSTPTECSLARLWSEILQVDPVGIHDNFFELGGDSLMLTQLSWKITEMLEVDIPLVEIFTKLSIAEFSATLETMLNPPPPAIPSTLARELGARAASERES